MPLANKVILCLGILLFLESAVSTESAALTDEYESWGYDESDDESEDSSSAHLSDAEFKHLLVSGFIRMNAEEKSFSVPETIQQIIEKSIIVGGVCKADPHDDLINLVGNVSSRNPFIREAYRVAGGLEECSATRAGAWCEVGCSPEFFPVATYSTGKERHELIQNVNTYTDNTRSHADKNDIVYTPPDVTSKKLKCSHGNWVREDGGDPFRFSCQPGCSMNGLERSPPLSVGLRMKKSQPRYYNSPHPNSPGVLYECTNGHEIRYDGKLVSIRHRCTAGHFYWRPQYLIEGTSEWIYLKSEDHRRFKCGAVLLWKPEPSVDDSDSSEEDSVDDSDSSEEDTPSPQTGFVSSQKMQRQTGSDLYQQQRQKIRDTADPPALPQPAPRQPVLKPQLARTVCDAPTDGYLRTLHLVINTANLTGCKHIVDGATCTALQCALPFKKSSNAKDLALKCDAKTNSWSMTGTICIQSMAAEHQLKLKQAAEKAR
eukprot:201815_1